MIELTIVIAILLILVTMLLPVLNKAKSHVHFSRWSAYTHDLKRNEGVVTYYDFQEVEHGKVPNLASGLAVEPYVGSELDATMGSAVDLVSGRWISKYGVEFSGGAGPEHQVLGTAYKTWEEKSISISVSFYLDAVGGRYGLVTRYAPGQFLWGVEVQPNGKLNFYVVDETGAVAELESQSVLKAGDWRSVFAVYDEETDEMKLYLDGQLDAGKVAGTTGSLMADPAGVLYVGDYPALAVSAPDGLIDEVIVWNKPVSSTVVSEFVKMSDQ